MPIKLDFIVLHDFTSSKNHFLKHSGLSIALQEILANIFVSKDMSWFLVLSCIQYLCHLEVPLEDCSSPLVGPGPLTETIALKECPRFNTVELSLLYCNHNVIMALMCLLFLRV